MKILIIGGNGTIGKKVSNYFSKNHDVVIGGRQSGDVRVDIGDKESIPMPKVVNGYVKSVLGKGNGEIIRIYDN